MRLHGLPAAYLRANTFYFSQMGWESADLPRRFIEWLDEKEDREIREKVLSWLRREVDWITDVMPYAIRQYWYLAPIVYFVAWHTRNIWKREITRLETEMEEKG